MKRSKYLFCFYIIYLPRYQTGLKQKPGLIGELIPPHLVKDADLNEDLETTFALLKYCMQPSFRQMRLSNCQKINPHGEKVIDEIKKLCNPVEEDYEELENFIRLWRKDFLETMKPKYLPHGWSIDHKM